MYRSVVNGLALVIGLATLASAQTPQAPVRPDWRRIGNSVIDLALASPGSGAVDRVWYSGDGTRLYARTAGGRVFETADFEKWQPSTATPPPVTSARSGSGLNIRTSATNPDRLYAYSSQVARSDDGGRSWANLTSFDRHSIIGSPMADLAVSPGDAEEVTAANGSGVWRSLDGGISWTGLNESLPNLPVRRIATLPQGAAGVRLVTDGVGAIEWAPGEKQSWRPVSDAAAARDAAARKALSAELHVEVTALATAGDFAYAGSADGRLWVSTDKSRTWTPSAPAERGAVEAIFADARESRTALAVSGSATGARVFRTVNAGQFWDDLTSDLPEGAVHGITADLVSGSIYLASDRGVFMTRGDLIAAAGATPWRRVAGIPEACVRDVKLDADANQLYVAVEGYGLFAAMAPHRVGNPRLVNAADFSRRAAAPGSLLSVLGGKVRTAKAGDLNFPVLAVWGAETQIQVPFEARGSSLSLALETGEGSYRLAVPLENVSPAIFVDPDGTPLLLGADSGVLLDAMNTAHSNARVQILATGLGRVRPDWPAGRAVPLDSPPAVTAAVHAYLDRAPVEVTRAVLAPGYIGLYLVEVQLPALVNSGPAELYIESEGKESNRVRLWIEP